MNGLSLGLLYKTAKQALLVGGDVLRKGFAKKHHVIYKTPTSPVTQVDREAERKIIALIRRRFPTHVFLAEESDFLNKKTNKDRQQNRYRWIIDPLDGTVNFMHGLPQSSVSVAVDYNGRIWAGGVYDPFRDELFMAQAGKGATLNGRSIRVSKERDLSRSLLVTGFPYNRARWASHLVRPIQTLLRKGIDIRRLGSAALDLAWTACGRVDGYWEYNLKPWDIAAGWLLVEEAGGRITNFSGGPLRLDNPRQTLASNGLIHDRMISVMLKRF